MFWKVDVAEVDEAKRRERTHHLVGRYLYLGLVQLIICLIQRQ